MTSAEYQRKWREKNPDRYKANNLRAYALRKERFPYQPKPPKPRETKSRSNGRIPSIDPGLCMTLARLLETMTVGNAVEVIGIKRKVADRIVKRLGLYHATAKMSTSLWVSFKAERKVVRRYDEAKHWSVYTWPSKRKKHNAQCVLRRKKLQALRGGAPSEKFLRKASGGWRRRIIGNPCLSCHIKIGIRNAAIARKFQCCAGVVRTAARKLGVNPENGPRFGTSANYNKARARLEIDALSDRYLVKLIRANTSLSTRDIPQSLIELKKAELMAKRQLKRTPCKSKT